MSLTETALFLYNNYTYIMSAPIIFQGMYQGIYQGVQGVIIVYKCVKGTYKYFFSPTEKQLENIQVLDIDKDVILVESQNNDWNLITKFN